jgi:hypothetical protein
LPIGLPANSRFTTPNPSFAGLASVLPAFPKVSRCVKIGIPVLLQAKIVAACEDFSARESPAFAKASAGQARIDTNG